jgi:hypothetical protein
MLSPRFVQKIRQTILAVALTANAAVAAAATLHVELATDTMGAANPGGWLDLRFNPDAGAVRSYASLDKLVGFGDSTSALYEGQVSGSAPSGFIFANGESLNRIFHPVQFGGLVSFDVNFNGTDDGAPMPASTVFSLALFAADGSTKLGSADAATGSLLRLSWLPPASPADQGTVSISNFDTAHVRVSAVPEPSSWLMLGAGLALAGVLSRRRARPPA